MKIEDAALEKALVRSGSKNNRVGVTSRPGSIRSRSGTRSGAISAAVWTEFGECSRQQRKTNLMISNVESGGSVESNPGNVDAGGSFESSPSKRPQRNRGWCSAARSRPKNAWTERYHRALSFLRIP